MAFPVVEEAIESATNNAGSSHAVDLPTATAGQLLLIILDKGSTSATINDHASLTELLDEASANGLYIAYRWMDGTEPSTYTLTSSANTRTARIAYRISGAENPATQAPQIGSTSSGTSATPDPPASASPGSTKDFLFIAFYGAAGEEADDDTWSDTPPTNFTPTPPRQKACGTAGTNLGGMIAAAERQLNTGSALDPGTFAKDASAAWRAQTILIHPASSVTIEADGSSAGVGASSVVGAMLTAGVTASDGVASSSVVGAGVFAGVTASDGVASSAVVGAAIFAGVTASDGVASSSVVASAIFAGVYSSEGTSTADAENVSSGPVEADGLSEGVASSSVVGSALWLGVGASEGIGSADGIAAAFAESVFSADGVGSSSVTAAPIFAGVYSSAGVATVLGEAESDAPEVEADFSSDGAATVSGVSAALFAGVWDSAGVAEVSGTSGAVWGAVSSTEGIASSAFESASLALVVAAAAGIAAVDADGIDRAAIPAGYAVSVQHARRRSGGVGHRRRYVRVYPRR